MKIHRLDVNNITYTGTTDLLSGWWHLIWLLVSAILLSAGCVSQEQHDRDMEAFFAKRRADSDAYKGNFPGVMVGMKFSELTKQIDEMNPPTSASGESTTHRNVGISHIAEYGDVKTIMYYVGMGLGYAPMRYVTVTVRGDTVIGYSQ
jgi:hypothetical protein